MGYKFDVHEYPIFGADDKQKWNHTFFPANETLHNILDIGSYDASFAKACVERWPNCRVWCVEPNPFLHYHYNDLENITLIDGALSYNQDKNVMNIRGTTEENGEIFDNFYIVGNTTYHSSSKTAFGGGGLGLGLPIAKGIILAHGGQIWVESPGQDEKTCPGSTFYVFLPFSAPKL